MHKINLLGVVLAAAVVASAFARMKYGFGFYNGG